MYYQAPHTYVMAHRLLTKNLETRTGTCSECGTTDISPSGAYWKCASAVRSRTKAWKTLNPDRAKAQKQRNITRRLDKPREHELESLDALNLIGTCVKDGPVDIFRAGRGWVCERVAQHCKCDTDVLWGFETPEGRRYLDMCAACWETWANWLVHQGELEPVLDRTWPGNRVPWDQAVLTLDPDHFNSMAA